MRFRLGTVGHGDELLPTHRMGTYGVATLLDFLPCSFMALITIFGSQLGVFMFWGPIYHYSIASLFFANYIMCQMLGNIWGVVKYRNRNCAQYQLCRLGISSAVESAHSNPSVNCSGVKIEKWKWCEKCSLNMPVRANHCRYCKKCVLRQENHFFAFGCCIAVGNTRFFFLYFLWALTYGAWGVATCALFVVRVVDSEDPLYGQYIAPMLELMRMRLESGEADVKSWVGWVMTFYFSTAVVRILALISLIFFIIAALSVGAAYTTEILWQAWIGMGYDEERDDKAAGIRGDAQDTSFMQRLNFLLGPHVLMWILIPPPLLIRFGLVKAEITWDQAHRESLIDRPLKDVASRDQHFSYN
ncbi:unnamed protein product, partial [Mesorhabditis spiculigera]